MDQGLIQVELEDENDYSAETALLCAFLLLEMSLRLRQDLSLVGKVILTFLPVKVQNSSL